MEYVFAIVLLIASFILQAVLAPGPPPAALPSSLKDFDVPTVDEGTPQAVMFGECWSGDWTVLWYGDFAVQPTSQSGGGKKG